MDFGDYSDNPFSLERTTPHRSKRKAVISALKFLLLVVVCLAFTVVVGSQSRKLVLHHLTHDLDSLSAKDKQARLTQIADLGTLGIEPLVMTLADNNVDVARAAFELLSQSQNEWTVLDRRDLQSRHGMMVDAIRLVAIRIPDDRTGWGTSLLQQTIVATVDRRDDQSRALYRNAMEAMDLLMISDRAGPSILSDEELDPLTPRRLIVRAEPLPVSAVDPVDQWTAGTPLREEAVAMQTDKADPSESPQSVVEAPSVYKSSSTSLQPTKSGEAVILRDVSELRETALPTMDIRPVTHLVDSPMETFDDRSVIHWLASPDPEFREKARLELMSRGYDDAQIAIATQIASGDTRTRKDLIDSIVHSNDIDPRPWLLMMLSDDSRDVKLRVISVLATMNDPDVTQRLRMHLVDERDPTVEARIRRVLGLR
jgi:hypothetical protein